MLASVLNHPWDLGPQQAIALQRELASRVISADTLTSLRWVAGVDVGIVREVARAAVVVLTYPELTVIECVAAERPVTFPYIPGLLSFREAPVILDALARLSVRPDLLMFDGQGIAHPRRLGIAAHLGVLLDHPTIGCAKSRLSGVYDEPGPERGDHAWLRDHDEIIGAVLRTRARVKPMFVSVGHKMRLESALEIVLGCGCGYRLPEPTRQAHHFASSLGQEDRNKE